MKLLRRARAYLRLLKQDRPCAWCGVRARSIHWSVRPPEGRFNPDRMLLEAMSLSATLVLNVFDAMLTLAGHQKGILLEANPLLVPLVSVPVVFVGAKMGLVVFGLGVLWLFRHHRWVLPAGLGLFVAYSIVIIYHLQGLLDVCFVVP
mgnify:CR=1 FL=1